MKKKDEIQKYGNLFIKQFLKENKPKGNMRFCYEYNCMIDEISCSLRKILATEFEKYVSMRGYSFEKCCECFIDISYGLKLGRWPLKNNKGYI